MTNMFCDSQKIDHEIIHDSPLHDIHAGNEWEEIRNEWLIASDHMSMNGHIGIAVDAENCIEVRGSFLWVTPIDDIDIINH